MNPESLCIAQYEGLAGSSRESDSGGIEGIQPQTGVGDKGEGLGGAWVIQGQPVQQI